MGKSDCFWFRKVSVLLALLQVSIALAPVMGHKAAVLTEPHFGSLQGASQHLRAIMLLLRAPMALQPCLEAVRRALVSFRGPVQQHVRAPLRSRSLGTPKARVSLHLQ